MKKSPIFLIGLAIVACVPLGYFQTTSQAQAELTATALVDPAWLEQRIADPEVRIIELGQTREEYVKAHITGAVFVDWKTEITDPAMPERYNKISKEKMQMLLGDLGIRDETTVVLYDNLDNRLAARMFWMLRYYGHEKIRILNGGRDAWRRAENDFVSDIPVFEKTEYRVGQVHSTYSVSMNFIKAKLAAPEFELVDGRPNEQFSGEEPGKVFHTGTEHARRGHIPGALNIAWKENLKEDGTFKSMDDLRQLYKRHGVTKEKTIIAYCNEGLHAASPWFVLAELLGYPDVRLYDDSLSEWANSQEAPLIAGNKP